MANAFEPLMRPKGERPIFAEDRRISDSGQKLDGTEERELTTLL